MMWGALCPRHPVACARTALYPKAFSLRLPATPPESHARHQGQAGQAPQPTVRPAGFLVTLSRSHSKIMASPARDPGMLCARTATVRRSPARDSRSCWKWQPWPSRTRPSNITSKDSGNSGAASKLAASACLKLQSLIGRAYLMRGSIEAFSCFLDGAIREAEGSEVDAALWQGCRCGTRQTYADSQQSCDGSMHSVCHRPSLAKQNLVDSMGMSLHGTHDHGYAQADRHHWLRQERIQYLAGETPDRITLPDPRHTDDQSNASPPFQFLENPHPQCLADSAKDIRPHAASQALPNSPP